MGPVARVWLGASSIPIIAIAVMVARFSPPYIPNVALGVAASDPADLTQGRAGILEVLRQCGIGRYADADAVPTRFATIRSFENDSGFLGTTRIVCGPGSRCTISATALIPHVAEPDICRGDGRRGRGRMYGATDYFPRANINPLTGAKF